MGEKLELRLKSPVGAEPAVYPWPLPVYVSVLAGRPGLGVAGLRSSGPAAGLRPFLARARGCRCPDAACCAVAAAGLEPRLSGRCGPESGATLWAGPRGLRGRGRLVSVSVLRDLLSRCHLTFPHAVVSVSSC